jgi:serine protease Do
MPRFGRIVVALAFLLAGCQQDVKQALVLTPLKLGKSDDTRPFYLEGVEFNLRRGQDIGGFQGDFFTCVPTSERLTWERGRSGSNLEWADRFYEVFSELEFPVVGNPSNVIERNRERSRAEYVLVAQVDQLELAVCDKVHPLFGTRLGFAGKSYLGAKWQVYSRIRQQIVYETRSEGTAEIATPSRGGIETLLLAGFEAAARNLAADPAFRDLVAGAPTTAPRDVGSQRGGTLALAGIAPARGTLQEKINSIRAAVPTVDMGNGHGSGVFISEDGYLLTNDHVVQERRNVTVRLAGGTELLGEVLRTDAVRDIALVKVPLLRAPAVPIRRGPVDVGEEVYAVGTPIQTRLGQTVTRGIVSALRDERRPGGPPLPLIQSDVVIQGGNSGGGLFDGNGNLVGIAVSGFGQMNSGTNFFIPIDDALARLGIELSVREARPAR